MIKLAFAAVAFVLVLTACPSVPPAAPDADCDAGLEARHCPPCTCVDDAGAVTVVDGGGDLAARACANLKKIECSDGLASDCARTLRTVMGTTDAQGRSLFAIDAAKLEVAKTIPEARAAGARCR